MLPNAENGHRFQIWGTLCCTGLLDDCFHVVEEGWVVSGQNEEYCYG
jgi:hypothetical protein